MPSFYGAFNIDSDGMYREALLAAGYAEVCDPFKSDFIVHDAVHPNLGPYLQSRPNFIVPHTPQSSFMWDGILPIDIPPACNFVYGQAGCDVMAAYRYPYRVEAIGFSRCEVREFEPTRGADLLIIPSHSLQHGEYTYSDYIDRAVSVLAHVLKYQYAFGRIVLCWNETRFDPALMNAMRETGFIIIPTNPNIDKDPLKRMMGRIEQANLVMACGTAGCVSVAMGKPTVFMTETNQARSNPRDALHSELYIHHLRFPLAVEDMTIEEILAVRRAPNEKV